MGGVVELGTHVPPHFPRTPCGSCLGHTRAPAPSRLVTSPPNVCTSCPCASVPAVGLPLPWWLHRCGSVPPSPSLTWTSSRRPRGRPGRAPAPQGWTPARPPSTVPVIPLRDRCPPPSQAATQRVRRAPWWQVAPPCHLLEATPCRGGPRARVGAGRPRSPPPPPGAHSPWRVSAPPAAPQVAVAAQETAAPLVVAVVARALRQRLGWRVARGTLVPARAGPGRCAVPHPGAPMRTLQCPRPPGPTVLWMCGCPALGPGREWGGKWGKVGARHPSTRSYHSTPGHAVPRRVPTHNAPNSACVHDCVRGRGMPLKALCFD
jgi:hypothetical protein